MGQNAVHDHHPFESIARGRLESGTILQSIYLGDGNPDKVNLLRGAYEADAGTPFVLPSTALARQKLLRDANWHHDYLPFLGNPGLLRAGEELHFGSQSRAVTCQLIASMQTVGATGALRMGGRFLKAHYAPWKESGCKLYLSKDTWANHGNIFGALDIQLVDLPYYDPGTKSLGWDAFKDAISALPAGSVILLQTAGHNPTGCDPTSSQWHELVQIFLSGRHVAFLDCAYLDLISGDLSVDASAIRMLEAAGVPLLLASTFGKSFGLYGERVGMLSIVAPSHAVRCNISSQMTLMARSETGAGPVFGAKVVEAVLGDEAIKAVWTRDINHIAAELRRRRRLLKEELELLRTPGNWEFVTQQVGMFSYLDFTPSQLDFLRIENHLYIDRNSRLSFSIQLVARGINNMIRSNVA